MDFLREVEAIRSALLSVEENDITNYDSMIQGIIAVASKTWSSTVSIDIVLITDGSPGFGPSSLREIVDKAQPFPFPAKMNVLSLSKSYSLYAYGMKSNFKIVSVSNKLIENLNSGDPNEKNFTENCQMLQQLIQVTAGEGLVYLPENHLNSKVSFLFKLKNYELRK